MATAEEADAINVTLFRLQQELDRQRLTRAMATRRRSGLENGKGPTP